jgi:hypothetical protein
MEVREEVQRLPEVVDNLKGVGKPGLKAKCLARTDKKAIYERQDDVWEVFLIKVRPAEKAFGKDYPAREAYPSNEDFGKWAWCYSNEQRAWNKYNRIWD